MNIHTRRHITDQENIYGGKGKNNVALPVKRQGLGVRGALGDVNTNVQIQRNVNIGKVAVAAAEIEQKAQNRAVCRSNYGHVQAKIDTGRSAKNILPAPRLSLRREESTASLATRAAVRTRSVLIDTQNKIVEPKDSSNPIVKKATEGTKKTAKVPSTKNNSKGKENVSKPKPILKDPTESLGKLRLSDCSNNHANKANKIVLPSPKITLPDDIEDIDAADKNNPMLMSTYIKDIYEYLTELELLYPVEPDHLRNQSEITGKMRATLIDWLVEVQQQFALLLETFQTTVGIIDRYLQLVPNVARDRLQLIGVTAMYIASKYEEVYPPDVGDFVYVTASAYKKEEVFKCEREIMTKLQFCLARPIPLSFSRRLVKAAHGTSKHHHMGKYFVDLCLVEYSTAHHRPSQLAAAAVCLALHLQSQRALPDVWTPTLAYYSNYTLDRIMPIVTKIAKLVLSVENTKYQAVHKKYQDVTLAKVANHPELKGEAIRKLAKLPS